MGSSIWLGTMLMAAFLGYGQAKGKPEGCTDIPLLKKAMSQLPAEQQFPCDAAHLTVIRDIGDFLKEHPEIAANAGLRWKAEHAMAFTLGAAWPVYVNLSSHPALTDAYRRGVEWVSYVFAGVLAHERVHATGTASEAAGLLAEFQLAQRVRAENKLPAEFDLAGLERQYREALEAER